MTQYLISFDDGAMSFPEEELPLPKRSGSSCPTRGKPHPRSN